MQDKIVLNNKSFKALSADSRVNILKNLNHRRMTLSELSKKLSLKNSTVKEHCSILVNAGLIEKIDEGRKWKYYELTNNGKQVIEPNFLQEAKVLVMLCFSAILFAGIFFTLIGYFENTYTFTPTQEYASEMRTFEAGIMSDAKVVSEIPTQESQNILIDPNNYFAFGIIISLIFGILVGWFVKREFA
jgi:DNA-binding transcriptional ArsR family regulator